MTKFKSESGITLATPIGRCAPRLILQRFEILWKRRRAVLAKGAPEEIHQLRVASRRLRSCMADLAGVMPSKGHRKLLRRVRALTQALGTVRDLDVLLDSLKTKRAGLVRGLRPGVDPLIRQWQQERALRARALKGLLRELNHHEFERPFRRWLNITGR